jgi:formylglycine-generating enzyme required for sulfatase activity
VDETAFNRIPEGNFRMGWLTSVNPISASVTSQPGPEVAVSSFYMQKTEVTNGEIERFIAGLGPGTEICQEWKKNYRRSTRDLREVAKKLPATNISWRIAATYAAEKGGKLPTEAQWECAARSGGKNYAKVWGDRDEPKHPGNIANVATSPAVVMSYDGDVTDQGVFDLTGNVQEWCRDVFEVYKPGEKRLIDPAFPPASLDESDKRPMVVRGGGFISSLEEGATTYRPQPQEGTTVTNYLGFRIVIECPEGPPDSR